MSTTLSQASQCQKAKSKKWTIKKMLKDKQKNLKEF
jgi:hypothetical protein